MMRETEDGFRIAEEDLRLRGEGEVSAPANPASRRSSRAAEADGDLLTAARDDARLIVERDPSLKGGRGTAFAGAALPVRARRGGELLQAG